MVSDLNELLSSCPICSGLTNVHLVMGKYAMRRCISCSTSFCDPMPSEAELNSYYAGYHLPDQQGGVYDSVETRMQCDFPEKCRQVLLYSSKPKLLDVGCGKGYFVKYCQSRGIPAQGIDVSESAVQFAARDLHVSLHHGMLENCTTLDEKYDSITLWATIEHLRDPRSTVLAAVSKLKVGGFLHLDTGIGFDWLDRLLPGNVQWFDPPQHLFVFSAKGLRLLLEQCGLRIIRHDKCFERSFQRKVMRILRNAIAASCFRGLASALFLTRSMKQMSRLPIGNLQSISAQKL